MTIIIADYIYTPAGYIESKAIAFDKQIQAIGAADELTQLYPDAHIVRAAPHSIVYPGLINTHVHLEFSANSTTLEYGDFMSWLDSVIVNREDLIESCDNRRMAQACKQMLDSGITSFGAISSFGMELEVCQETPQRVTFFNELIGSDAKTADILYGDFIERVATSEASLEEHRITPAIAIHSPYSVHPILLQRAITLAKQKNCPLSTHFMESPAEKQWLESSSGDFAGFFQKFFGATQAVTTIDEFLHQFDSYPSHFVHCTQTSFEQKAYLYDKGHSIAHCPRSNRLLGCGRLAIEDIEGVMSIATDGLSSNYSLNLWDELRAALMLHHQGALELVADRFIRSVTSDAAKAIRLDAGEITVGKPADLIIVALPERCSSSSSLSLQAILHTQKAQEVYIDGERVG